MNRTRWQGGADFGCRARDRRGGRAADGRGGAKVGLGDVLDEPGRQTAAAIGCVLPCGRYAPEEEETLSWLLRQFAG